MFRPLHYVFRLANRKSINTFYIDILGMKVLRHEEFREGCEATCNGPYAGKWSKTMIGYGNENEHFVIELTYNYGISSYKISNDLQYVRINSRKAFTNVKRANYEYNLLQHEMNDEIISLHSPDGYRFLIVNKDNNGDNCDPLSDICLSVRDLKQSTDYYTNLLPGRLVSKTNTSSTIQFDELQWNLVLEIIDENIVKTTASGRIAFSYQKEVREIEEKIKDTQQRIKTSLITLDTPGKASVDVVILLDPNDHEICVVGDKGFRELSQLDPSAEKLLEKAMSADRSDEWFSKKGGKSISL